MVVRTGTIQSACHHAQEAVFIVVTHLQSQIRVSAELGGTAFVRHFDGHAVVIHEGAAVGDAGYAVAEELACLCVVEIPGVARGGQCGEGHHWQHH